MLVKGPQPFYSTCGNEFMTVVLLDQTQEHHIRITEQTVWVKDFLDCH